MSNPKEPMTISRCLKKFIILGQIFGYFPVQGLSDSIPKFSYLSIRFVYAVLSIIGPTFLCLMQLIKALGQRINIDQIHSVIKYASSAYVGIVFVSLGRKWPRIIEKWRKVEVDMQKYGFPKKLNRSVGILIGFFMATFLVELVLHQWSRLIRALDCSDDLDKSLKFFFGNLTLSHVFKYIPYNIPTSLLLQYWVCQVEFALTYTDIFVMVISLCLASRLKQVSQKIKYTSRKQIADKDIWRELRADYTRIQSLIEMVNENISNIILVSFLPNVFTILNQVFSTLKPKQNTMESFYFYVSLVFLVSRTAMVCICGAKVNEESRKPLHLLNSVSHEVYNKEIEVFINQLLNFEISMNGKHFFNIKRYVILEIAGAIVTYELVLIEFNQDSLSAWAKSTRCE